MYYVCCFLFLFEPPPQTDVLPFLKVCNYVRDIPTNCEVNFLRKLLLHFSERDTSWLCSAHNGSLEVTADRDSG